MLAGFMAFLKETASEALEFKKRAIFYPGF